MQRLIVERVDGGAPVVVHAGAGARLLDLCDEHSDAEPLVSFSCRSASCGTCRVVVVEGGDALEPADREELGVLREFGDDVTTHRLACQARFRQQADATVRIRAAD